MVDWTRKKVGDSVWRISSGELHPRRFVVVREWGALYACQAPAVAICEMFDDGAEANMVSGRSVEMNEPISYEHTDTESEALRLSAERLRLSAESMTARAGIFDALADALANDGR